MAYIIIFIPCWILNMWAWFIVFGKENIIKLILPNQATNLFFMFIIQTHLGITYNSLNAASHNYLLNILSVSSFHKTLLFSPTSYPLPTSCVNLRHYEKRVISSSTHTSGTQIVISNFVTPETDSLENHPVRSDTLQWATAVMKHQRSVLLLPPVISVVLSNSWFLSNISWTASL